MKKIKDILATSCLDILSPARYHGKIYTTEVIKNISNYSIGQTEYGSYILNILCPLGNYQYRAFSPMESELPLNRRINMRLLSSIGNIQTDLNENNMNKVDEDVEQGKYSVNFLDALANVYDESKESKVNIIMDWCDRVKFADSFEYNNVQLEPIHIDKVRSIAEKYRPKREENIYKNYFGKIESITANPNVENREYIQIKIATIGENNKKMNIQTKLNYTTYHLQVNDAFNQGLNVKLSGILKDTGKIKWIEDCELEILG